MSVPHIRPIRNSRSPSSFDLDGASHPAPLPWPAERIRLRHGLTPAAALIVATEAGFVLEGGRE